MTVNDLIKLCNDKGVSLDTPIYYLQSDGNYVYPTVFVMREEDLSVEELIDGKYKEGELPYICVGD
jgi:hypothetical protein